MTLQYWCEGPWFVGRLRAMPDVCSHGRTLDELNENIADAYRLVVDDSEAELPVREYRTTTTA